MFRHHVLSSFNACLRGLPTKGKSGFSLYSPPQKSQAKGFALPLAMGLGFVMLILGTTTLIISQGDRTTAFQRKETGASFAATEGGIARTLAQLTDTNNSVLLTQNYDPINPETGTTYFGPDGILQSGDEESVAEDEWTSCLANPSTCSTETGSGPSLSLSGNIGSNGQYSLKAYRYDSTQQTGIFLVEGQQRGSTSYVVVTMSIDVSSESAASGLYPSGLWIRWNPDADAGNLGTLQTNIRDSTGTSDSDASKIAKLKAAQGPIPSSGTPVTYSETPGKLFPALPIEGQSPPTTGLTGAYSIAEIDASLTLPAMGQTANAAGILTYHIGENGGKSISLSNGNDLTLGTGTETIELYLDGGISMSGGRIIVAPGTKLIIYAHGKVALSGGGSSDAIENNGDLEDIQLYVYTDDEVSLSGASTMELFLFAPDSKVQFSSNAKVSGAIWSRSWSGSSDSGVIEQSLDFNKTKLAAPSSRNRITGLTSWQRVQL